MRINRPVYEGWVVVAASAAMVMVVAGTFFYGLGTIFTDVRAEFGWGVGVTAIAFSLRSEVGGIASPIVGWFLDRYGPRQALRAGVLLSSLGAVGMSFSSNLWQFYLAMLAIAAGNSAAGGQVGQYATATWFRAKRATAMAVMTVGGAFGGVLVVGIALMVDELGWRGALRVIALTTFVFGFTIGQKVRRRPADHPQPVDGVAVDAEGATGQAFEWAVPFGEAVRSRSFRLIVAALIAADFGRVAIVVHQVPFIETELGQSKAIAGLTVTFLTGVSIFGRILMGVLADRFPIHKVFAASLGALALGIPMLALSTELWHVFAALLLIGPGFGGSIPLRPAMIAQYYGIEAMGRISGIGRLVATTGGALGAWLVGVTVDATGGYHAGWLLAAAVLTVSIPLMLAARPPVALQERYPVAVTGA